MPSAASSRLVGESIRKLGRGRQSARIITLPLLGHCVNGTVESFRSANPAFSTREGGPNSLTAKPPAVLQHPAPLFRPDWVDDLRCGKTRRPFAFPRSVSFSGVPAHASGPASK